MNNQLLPPYAYLQERILNLNMEINLKNWSLSMEARAKHAIEIKNKFRSCVIFKAKNRKTKANVGEGIYSTFRFYPKCFCTAIRELYFMLFIRSTFLITTLLLLRFSI